MRINIPQNLRSIEPCAQNMSFLWDGRQYDEFKYHSILSWWYLLFSYTFYLIRLKLTLNVTTTLRKELNFVFSSHNLIFWSTLLNVKFVMLNLIPLIGINNNLLASNGSLTSAINNEYIRANIWNFCSEIVIFCTFSYFSFRELPIIKIAHQLNQPSKQIKFLNHDDSLEVSSIFDCNCVVLC